MKKIESIKLYYCFATILFSLIFLRDIEILDVPLELYTVVFIAFLPFMKIEEIVGIGVSMAAFSQGLQINFIWGICALVLIVKYHARISINKICVVIGLLYIWEFMHLVIKPFSLSSYARYGFFIVFFAVVCCIEIKNVKKIYDIFLTFTMFAMSDIFAQFYLYNNKSIVNIFLSKYRFGNVYILNNDVKERVFDNEANIALFCLLAFILSIIQYKLYQKKIYIFSSAIFLLFGLMTRSKTFLICIGIIIIFFMSYFWKDKRNVIKLIKENLSLKIVIIIGCCLPIIYFLVKNTFSRFFTTSSLTTGRVKIFFEYNKFWCSNLKNIFFGIGIQQPTVKSGNNHSMHNFIQEIYVCWGVVGVILICLMFYFMYKNLNFKKLCSINKLSVLLGIIFFVYLNSIQYIRLPYIFVLTLLVYFSFYPSDRSFDNTI